MTTDQFFTTWNGKTCDWDLAYGGQCVDVYDQYCQDVIKSPILLVAGAVNIWDTYPTAYFDRVLNTPEAVPQKGDVMIWGKGAGPYGHVAIFKEGDVNSFTSFDQNWPTGSACHFQTHDYLNVIGWLHPKSQPSDELTECLRQHTELVNECTKKDTQITQLTSIVTDKNKELAQKSQLIDNLNQQILDRNADIVKLNADVSTLNTQLLSTQQQIATLTESAKQVPDLKDQITHLEQKVQGYQQDLTTCNKSNAQLKNTSYKTVDSSLLMKELLARLFEKIS